MCYTSDTITRESFIFLLGIVVVATSFLGIPGEWKQYSIIGAGILIVIVGYQLRRAAYLRSIEVHNGERQTEMFVENRDVSADPQESQDE